MPTGTGRPASGGHRKLLNTLQKSNVLQRQLRDSSDPSTMHMGYEGIAANHRTLNTLGRSTDSDYKHRQTMREIEHVLSENVRVGMENRKRMAAGPSSNVSEIGRAGKKVAKVGRRVAASPPPRDVAGGGHKGKK